MVKYFQVTNLISIKLFLLSALLSTTGLELDSDGGYHVTIGIQSDQVVDSQIYLERIKTEITSLSSLIYGSTNDKFQIKSATILLPSHWDYEEDEVAKSLSFPESDIRISDDYVIPDVSRKIQCGYPAEALILPTNYFEDSTNDLYKAKDKSLLHLWAQFRWGVFEEGGFPFNTRFPYFHKPLDSSEWKVNACTDKELEGSYEYPNGTICITDDSEIPDSECRFYPDQLQTEVKSSLMTHFHWIDAMNSFCTSETHDVTFPNRQNVMCGYKSAKEIMESCPDFLKVTEASAFVDPVFTILKESDKPLLYFLIDSKAITQVPLIQINFMKSSLRSIFDVGLGVDSDSLGGLAIFPGRNGEVLEELISWTPIVQQVNEFRMGIDHISTISTTIGYFGNAIKSVSESIRARQHAAGAFIFIFKSSSGTDFEQMNFEHDVITSLSIKLLAVEVNNGPLDPGMSLSEVAVISGGSSLSLSSSSIPEELQAFIKLFIEDTKAPIFTPASLKLTDMRIITSSTEEITLSHKPSGPIHIKLTTSLYVNNVILKTASNQEIVMDKKNEWNEGMAQGRRVTFQYTHQSPVLNEILTFSISCMDNANEKDCRGFLVFYEEQEEDNLNVSVSTSTSAIDNIFDGNMIYIYAMIQQNLQPLVRLTMLGDLSASATLCLEEDPISCTTIKLTDNGAGEPDLMTDDGILSGTIVALEDGIYNCWITVHFEYYDEKKEFLEFVPNHNLLVKAVDQNMFPCSLTPDADVEQCVGTIPIKSFRTVTSSPNKIISINSEKPEPHPTRIYDLTVESAANSPETFSFMLSWTAPFVPNNGIIEKVASYDIKYCLSLEQFLDDFDSCTTAAALNLSPEDPGKMQIAIIDIDVEEGLECFFAVKSSSDTLQSDMSNVVRGKATRVVTDPTSPTTTDTTESGTTEEVTTGESTTEEVTTEASTTGASTTDESTTGQSTTDESTPGESTTDESTTGQSTTDESTPGESTTDESTTGESTTDESTTGESTTVESTTEEVTTEGTTEASESTSTETSTSEVTTETDEAETSPETGTTRGTSTSRTNPTTSPLPPTEQAEYFFKKPEGYITVGVIGFVALGGLGGAVGYLFWKRNQLMMLAETRNKLE